MGDMAAMTARLREALVPALREAGWEARVNGPGPEGGGALPNTLSLSVKGLQASAVIDRLRDTVALSAGAACHSGGTSVSHVLAAIGLPLEFAMGTLRLSVGRYTTAEEVDAAAAEILGAVGAPPS